MYDNERESLVWVLMFSINAEWRDLWDLVWLWVTTFYLFNMFLAPSHVITLSLSQTHYNTYFRLHYNTNFYHFWSMHEQKTCCLIFFSSFWYWKLEEGEDFLDVLNPCTRREALALGDSNMRNLKCGEILQLERKGYFRCDVPFVRASKPIVLLAIPDGRQQTSSRWCLCVLCPFHGFLII